MLVVEAVGEVTTVVSTDGSGQSVPINGVRDASWVGDGRVLGLHGARAVVRMTVGGAVDTVFRGDSMHALRHPVALPQDDAILVVRGIAGGEVSASEVVAVTLATGDVTPVVRAVHARLLATGELLYVTANGNVFVTRFDARSHRVVGNPTPVADVVIAASAEASYPEISVSDEGTMIYLVGQLQWQRVVWLDKAGRRERPLDIEGDIWGLALTTRCDVLRYETNATQTWSSNDRFSLVSPFVRGTRHHQMRSGYPHA